MTSFLLFRFYCSHRIGYGKLGFMQRKEVLMEIKDDAARLGKIIRKHRKEKDMTQADLACHSQMNESYLSAVECGYSYVSVSKYLSICDGLGVCPLELMKEYIAELEPDPEEGPPSDEPPSDTPSWFLDAGF